MIKKWKQLILAASFAALSSLLPVQAVQAEQLKLSGSMIREWNNGTQVDTHIDKNGSIQIQTSTEGLKKAIIPLTSMNCGIETGQATVR